MNTGKFLAVSLARLPDRLLKKGKKQTPAEVVVVDPVLEKRIEEVAENARRYAMVGKKISRAMVNIKEERLWASLMVDRAEASSGGAWTLPQSERLQMFQQHLAAVGGLNECSLIAYHALEALCFGTTGGDIKKLEFHRVVYIGEVVLAERRKVSEFCGDWKATEVLVDCAAEFDGDELLNGVLARHLKKCSSKYCRHAGILKGEQQE